MVIVVVVYWWYFGADCGGGGGDGSGGRNGIGDNYCWSWLQWCWWQWFLVLVVFLALVVGCGGGDGDQYYWSGGVCTVYMYKLCCSRAVLSGGGDTHSSYQYNNYGKFVLVLLIKLIMYASPETDRVDTGGAGILVHETDIIIFPVQKLTNLWQLQLLQT